MFACNGMLFNHESPLRGETFVTRKITRAAARIALGLQEKLYIGNLDALRDWGHARDYVEAMWLMLQQEKPDDFVIATGKTIPYGNLSSGPFRRSVYLLSGRAGELRKKVCTERPAGCLVEVDPRYFRPAEVETLLGDPSKAAGLLGWKPRVSFEELVSEMVRS